MDFEFFRSVEDAKFETSGVNVLRIIGQDDPN